MFRLVVFKISCGTIMYNDLLIMVSDKSYNYSSYKLHLHVLSCIHNVTCCNVFEQMKKLPTSTM